MMERLLACGSISDIVIRTFVSLGFNLYFKVLVDSLYLVTSKCQVNGTGNAKIVIVIAALVFDVFIFDFDKF